MIRRRSRATPVKRPQQPLTGSILCPLDEAAGSYRKAIELAPNHPETYNNLGNALQQQGRLEESIAAYDKAVELKPDFVEAYYNLGTALLKQGRSDAAAERFRRAIELKPNYLSERIVDKLPDNFLRVGLIRMLMPDARIIHIRRNPVDTCLSCFSILFTGNLPYAYDLAELGRFYNAYVRLMDHWRRVLPPAGMLEIDYENVVDDLDSQVAHILDYCDLEWDDRCLAFHESKRSVRTSSATQVRQPLYASAVGRWHVFGDLAQPLLDALNNGMRPEDN